MTLTRNAAPTPATAISPPASAGPMARAMLNSMALSAEAAARSSLRTSSGRIARHVGVSTASPAASANVRASNSHGVMRPESVVTANTMATPTIHASVYRISFRRSAMSPMDPAGKANRKNGSVEAVWVNATYNGPAPSDTISHAEPTPCMKVPTSDTMSATSSWLKTGVRSGRQRLGAAGLAALAWLTRLYPDSLGPSSDASTERERERLHASIEKLDLELPIDDRLRLTDELIQTWFDHRADAAFVDCQTVSWTGRLPVNRHAETNGASLPWRTHDEMKISRVKAIDDPAAGTAHDGRLASHRPFAGQRPLIGREPRRDSVGATPIAIGTSRRREILRPLVPDVAFWRPQVVPVRRLFRAAVIEPRGAVVDAGEPSFRQQAVESRLRLDVLTLTEVVLTNASPDVDEIESRPVLVVEGAPDCVVVVDRDWVLDSHLPHGTTDVVDVLLESELRCVHPDHDEAFVVLLRPCANIRQGAQPIDAGIGPEVDEHDLPGQV